MKTIALFGLSMMLMAVGLFSLLLAANLAVLTLEFGAALGGIEILFVIFLIALGAFAIARGWLLLQTLLMFYFIRKEIENENSKVGSRVDRRRSVSV